MNMYSEHKSHHFFRIAPSSCKAQSPVLGKTSLQKPQRVRLLFGRSSRHPRRLSSRHADLTPVPAAKGAIEAPGSFTPFRGALLGIGFQRWDARRLPQVKQRAWVRMFLRHVLQSTCRTYPCNYLRVRPMAVRPDT